jgi:hypothetical protein
MRDASSFSLAVLSGYAPHTGCHSFAHTNDMARKSRIHQQDMSDIASDAESNCDSLVVFGGDNVYSVYLWTFLETLASDLSGH